MGTSDHDDGGTPGEPEVSGPVNEGQRLLLAVNASLGAIAERVGVSKTTASYWRSGRKLPSTEARRELERAYRIHPSAWDRKPGPSAPALARVEDVAASGETTIDLVNRRQRIYAEMVENDKLSAPDRLRAGALEAKMIDTRRQLERDARLEEANLVQKSAQWAQVRKRTLDVLRGFPDALRAWTDAMGELAREGESARTAIDDEDESA
jgi:transcriptional regulator with XRE-family HTH domain